MMLKGKFWFRFWTLLYQCYNVTPWPKATDPSFRLSKHFTGPIFKVFQHLTAMVKSHNHIICIQNWYFWKSVILILFISLSYRTHTFRDSFIDTNPPKCACLWTEKTSHSIQCLQNLAAVTFHSYFPLFFTFYYSFSEESFWLSQ